MNTNITPQDLQAFEHMWLITLEGQINEIVAQIKAWTPPDHTFTTLQITFLVDFLVGAEKSIQSYEPQARYLYEMGLPRMWMRFSDILYDIRSARETYIQKRQSHITANQQEIAEGQRQAAEECIRIFQVTTDRQKQVFNDGFEKWRAIHFPDPIRPRLCPYCGRPLGGSHSYAVCDYTHRIIYD